jgi:hypothetical protein
MQVRINQQDFTYNVQGELGLTDGRVLLAADDDLTAGTAWAAAGYTVADFLPPTEQATLHEGLAQLVRQALADVGRPVPADFDVAHYHRVVGDDKALHLAVVNRTEEFRKVEALPLPASMLEQRVSELCGRSVSRRAEPLHLLRPNPAPSEVLLFSPYLLHGGAVNLNENETRISLEMRFWAA